MNDELMVRVDDIHWTADTGPGDADDSAKVVSVDLATLLMAIALFVCRYVVVTKEQATVLALWVAHTYVIAAAECTPYLAITSATKRSGKTRLLELLESIVFCAWLTGRTSAAALTRKVDADHPTLLLDESDATFNGNPEYAEALRGVLNTGYRQSGKTTLCVGQGLKIATKDFSTYCCKAIAGIGKLPDTVADRSIPIVLQRRKRDEPVERWRERDARRQAKPIAKALSEWANYAIAPLRDARPAIPLALGDRAADVVEPLLAIADAAGGDWPDRARQAVLALMAEADEDAIGIQLLADLRDIFGTEDAMPSSDIVAKLCEREDRPWATWSKGQRMTTHALARLLKPFGIMPGGAMRFGDKVERAYRRASFEDAWARYLPAPDEGNDAGRI